MRPVSEFERIRAMLRIAADLDSPDEVVLGAGDDCALVRPASGESIVLSTDLSIEWVHFRRDWLSWEAIGYRATAAALSDLAAMAARPIGVLVSMALPRELKTPVFEQLTAGIVACLESSGAVLLGGDTSRSPAPVMIDITAVGAVEHAIRRTGARPEDELWVTGLLGSAASAVLALQSGLQPDPGARQKFEHPEPRWREAIWLAKRNALSAAIDLSDGLAGDAGHLSDASGVRVDIQVGSLPIDPSLDAWSETLAPLALAAGGGEDYELLFTSPPGIVSNLLADFRLTFGIELTRIGQISEGEGVSWRDQAGGPTDPPASAGYDHFT
ncbi:MAG: thiamine-phosphate kinase, partial [Gemmatimonadales bacterium]